MASKQSKRKQAAARSPGSLAALGTEKFASSLKSMTSEMASLSPVNSRRVALHPATGGRSSRLFGLLKKVLPFVRLLIPLLSKKKKAEVSALAGTADLFMDHLLTGSPLDSQFKGGLPTSKDAAHYAMAAGTQGTTAATIAKVLIDAFSVLLTLLPIIERFFPKLAADIREIIDLLSSFLVEEVN